MSADNQPLVSVVTPVYNGERHLAECIESVLNQTYENWDYVIVNNRSTDRTLDIAQDYAERDRRIRIYNNETFLSLFGNHNNAVRQIADRSKYCKILQADDLMFPECLAEMVKLAEAHPSVGLVGSYRIIGDFVSYGLPYPTSAISGREICRKYLDGDNDVFGTPSSVLIRSDLVRRREALFNEKNVSADKEAECDILQDSDFGFVHQVLTYSRVHGEQAGSSLYRNNGFIIGKIHTFRRLGHLFFEKEEYERRLEKWMRDYYRILGGSALRMRGRKYWQYQRETLEAIGDKLDYFRIFRAALLEVMDALLNPKSTAERVLRKVTGNGKNAP
jgi:glycosyltransferase involved in cell wall biosynthesis